MSQSGQSLFLAWESVPCGFQVDVLGPSAYLLMTKEQGLGDQKVNSSVCNPIISLNYILHLYGIPIQVAQQSRTRR